jgi:hypothetical protein
MGILLVCWDQYCGEGCIRTAVVWQAHAACGFYSLSRFLSAGKTP